MGYGRSTTGWSSDAKAGGNESASNNTLSYAKALLGTDSEGVETTVYRLRLLFAGFVANIGEESLSRRVMFGEIVRGKGYVLRGTGLRLDEGPP